MSQVERDNSRLDLAEEHQASSAKGGQSNGWESVDFDINPLSIHLREIGSVPLLESTEHEKLGAIILAGQLALRALSQMAESKMLVGEQGENVRNFQSGAQAKFLNGQLEDRIVQAKKKAGSDEGFLETVANHDRMTLEQLGDLSQIEDSEERKKCFLRLLESQVDLAKKGIEAHRILVESNMRLVVSWAKGYVGQSLSFSDLIEYGYEGLMRAAARYDYKKGYQFSTYAIWWVRHAIGRAIQDFDLPIHIPVNGHGIRARLKKDRELASQQLGLEVSLEAVARDLRVETESLKAASLAKNVVSLNTVVNDENYTELGDLIADSSQDVEAQVQRSERIRATRDLLGILSPKERQVLFLRFGFGDSRPMSLAEVGREFNFTRERIRQIEAKAIEKLRRHIGSDGFSEFREEDPQAIQTNVARELGIRRYK